MAMGVASLTGFLAINGLDVALTHDEAFELTMAVADGSPRDVDAIEARLRTEPRA